MYFCLGPARRSYETTGFPLSLDSSGLMTFSWPRFVGVFKALFPIDENSIVIEHISAPSHAALGRSSRRLFPATAQIDSLPLNRIVLILIAYSTPHLSRRRLQPDHGFSLFRLTLSAEEFAFHWPPPHADHSPCGTMAYPIQGWNSPANPRQSL